MKKLLIVVDMQRDFVDGSLGTQEAQAIVPLVKERILKAGEEGWEVLFTRDTHPADYLQTQEGRYSRWSTVSGERKAGRSSMS